MADPPAYPDTGDDIGAAPDREATPSTPRWVMVFAIIAVALVVLVGIMLLSGHGPGRHLGGGHSPGRHAPLSIATDPTAAGGNTPPASARSAR